MIPRTILFGLDGAVYTVLDDLVRRGVMPALRWFTSEASRAILRSNIPPLTPPAWTSIVTGRTPGHHGITGFCQRTSRDSLAVQIVSSRQMCCETVWSMVNRHGLRAGSLNFVCHQPAPQIDGYVIPGWVPWRWLKRFSHPQGVIDRLSGALPEFDIQELAMDFAEERKSLAGTASRNYESWIDMHLRRDRQWFQILRHQLQNDPCELVGIVFDGVDKLQHLLWPYLDPRMEPASPSDGFRRIRRRCWDYFRQIDDFLREITELCGPDCTQLVVSDHGFTGMRDTLCINTWLEAHGYLAWRPKSDGSERIEPYFHILSAFDQSRTRAYALASSSNGIYIPVRGRSAEYGIAPEEYLEFRRELIELLLTQCQDPGTGEPVVTSVHTREEVFAGPNMDLAPDLTLTLRDHGFFSVRRSRSILKPRRKVMGTHHPDGIFIARGPGIRRGAVLEEPIRLVDIVPTLLYQLGVPVPEDLEGRAIREMFTPAHLAANTVRRGVRTHAKAAGAGEDALDAQTSGIMDKLKALGYVE